MLAVVPYVQNITYLLLFLRFNICYAGAACRSIQPYRE